MRSAMPTPRLCNSALEADVGDGATLLVHSFGPPQAWPTDCVLALAERGVRDLTVVCNTTAGGPTSLNVLADKKQIRRLVCSYVANPSFQTPIGDQVRDGEIGLEMVPQGTLIERVRAGGAGLPGFSTPTGAAHAADGKEVREFDGRPHVFERALRAEGRAPAVHSSFPSPSTRRKITGDHGNIEMLARGSSEGIGVRDREPCLQLRGGHLVFA